MTQWVLGPGPFEDVVRGFSLVQGQNANDKKGSGIWDIWRCSARLQPRAGAGWHDLERSHYNCVLCLEFGIWNLFSISCLEFRISSLFVLWILSFDLSPATFLLVPTAY